MRKGFVQQIIEGSALVALSVLPYLTVYVLDRVLGVPNAATQALWPAVIAPIAVAIAVGAVLVRARSQATSRERKVALATQPRVRTA